MRHLQDFKEAARLSAEAKAMAVSVESLTVDAKALGEALVALEREEIAVEAQLTELQAMHKVG